MSGREIGPSLDKEWDTMMKNYKAKSLVSYQPNNSVITSTDVGYIIKDMENGLVPLPMTRLNGNQLYTHETCKLQLATAFSDILYTEQEEIRTGIITKIPGLSYNVIVSNNNNNNNGYFNDNHTFFVNNIPKYTGISNPINLASIRTQNSEEFPTEEFPTEKFSVEWFGYVIPSKTESVKFSIESDDASYLWFGNKAIYEYNIDNATINNGGMHGMVKKETTIELTAGEIYPIRIQYGEAGGGEDFILKINDQDTYDGLYRLERDYKLYEQKQLYYALVEESVETTIGQLFKCFSYTTNGTDEINAKKLVLYMLSTRVSGSTNPDDIVEYESIPISSDGTGSYAEIDYNGFHLYTNGTRTSSIQTNFSNIPIYWLDLVPTIETDGSVRCQLSIKGLTFDTGTRRYKSTLCQQLWNEKYTDSAPSQIWKNEKTTKNRIPYLFRGRKLTKNNPLISNDYMFKLTLSDQGQLVLLRAKKIKINYGKYNKFRYTKTEDTKYIYNLRCDYRMNKTFVSDNIKKTFQFVPSNSTFLEYARFKEFNNYVPSNTDGETQVSSGTTTDVKANCQTQCKGNATCNAVYVYTKNDNTNWCKFVSEQKENIINNNVFNNKQPNSEIKSSTLYNKEQKMLSQIPTYSLSSKDNYTKLPLSEYKITDKLTDAIPSIENTAEYKELIRKYTKFYGNAAPLKAATIKENFTQYNQYDCSGQDCKSFIQTQKIDPLIKTASDYSKTLQVMNANNTTFSNNLNTYNSTYTDLSNNAVYQFRAEDTDFNNTKKSLLETANDDLNELLIQQNNMYIIGTITTATLLITAILLSSS